MKSLFIFFVTLLFGLISGSLFYAKVVQDCYTVLIENIKNATFTEALIEEDPALHDMKIPKREAKYSNNEIKWRLLRNAGVLKYDDLSHKLGCRVSNALFSNNELVDEKSFLDLRGLDYLCEFSAKLGSNHNPSNDNKERSFIIDIISHSMASYPRAEEIMQKSFDNIDTNQSIEYPKFSYFLLPRVSGISKSLPLESILGNFFSHYKIYFENLEGTFTLTDKKVPKVNCQQGFEEYRQTKEILSFVLISIYTNKDVENARGWLVVYEGPMQWAMFAAFFTGLYLLIYKAITKDSSVSKTITTTYKWIIGTLPILGFIGTILGLMIALRNADSIPLANGDFETSIAISNITDTLSTAFTTTLIAFILGVGLSFINLQLSYFFPQFVDDSE